MFQTGQYYMLAVRVRIKAIQKARQKAFMWQRYTCSSKKGKCVMNM